MFYFLMFVWLASSITFVVSLVIRFAKKKNNKLVLPSLLVSIISLTGSVVVNQQQLEVDVTLVSDDRVTVDATQFSEVSPKELVAIMGEPDLIEEWIYSLSDTRSYDATTYYFENEKHEFLVIDNQVVRYTFNGNKMDRNEVELVDLLRMFNIRIESDLIKAADTPAAIRYKNISDNIEDFWVTFLDDSTIFKITYDNQYF